MGQFYPLVFTPAPDAAGGWLQIDLGAAKTVTRSVVRFEYAWKKYAFTIEGSADGETWTTLADRRAGGGVSGSPVTVGHAGEARYLRIVFPGTMAGKEIGVIEWAVF